MTSIGALFQPGRILFTGAALEAFALVHPTEAAVAMRRHLTGDWGDVDRHDKRANNDALSNGDRLLSVYRLSTGVKFYIITEADRSATTYLLPDDY